MQTKTSRSPKLSKSLTVQHTKPPKTSKKPNLTVVKAPTSATTRNGIFILNGRELSEAYQSRQPPMRFQDTKHWFGMHYNAPESNNQLRMLTYGNQPGPGTVVANAQKLTKGNLNIIAEKIAPRHFERLMKKIKNVSKSKRKHPSALYSNLHLQPHQVLMFQGNATPHAFPSRRPNQKYLIYFGNYRNRGKSSLDKLRLATGYNWTLNELRNLENFFRAQRTLAKNNSNSNSNDG